MAQTFDSLKQYPAVTADDIQSAMSDCLKILSVTRKKYEKAFPMPNTNNDGIYDFSDNTGWTEGFFTGMLWLAYENTKDEEYRRIAEGHVDMLLDRIVNKRRIETHDMGFLYSLSCVAAYKLTGNEKGREAAVMAARNLVSRYREKGEFLQAWGSMDNPKEYRLIIDCLLNLPLLYWASETTGEPQFREKAEKHIHTAMKNIIRPDNSTYHTFFFDPQTGEPSHGQTQQGYRNDSAWARGQAWGIYGAALGYKYTKRSEYIDIFTGITDFFITHLPDDLVPYWDFDFDTGSGEPRDSSAGAIAVCGILEMSKYMDDGLRAKYIPAADRIMKALIDNCANKDMAEENGLLRHGSYCVSSPYNPCRNEGVDRCNLWGDYFYMEALTRYLTGNKWELYW